MRAGGCTVQQALTAEAANVVKQAVTLARRRGHAQVTPLHVANTMLAAPTGLLRTACLQSHSHPLQCKALELCFNVALNRLPALTSNPMLGPHHSQHPSLSNALVAAFKRAQAHQRRGSIENQQQPLLAMKIELEQLIISILDDPSVSRVMREAGFSSTQVKSNVEQAISSMEISSKNPSGNSDKSKDNNLLTLSQSPNTLGQTGGKVRNSTLSDSIRNEDVMYVVENLATRKRRSFVIVGECLGSIEGVVIGVMEKVDKGDVPEALKNVEFVSLSLPSFRHHSRNEIESKIEEIKSLRKSCMGSGIVLLLGDLRWVAEYRTSPSVQSRSYRPVEHMVNELGKLVCGTGESGRFWLMGIATFQAYMRCKNGNPSLETVLGLHPLTVPAGSLRLGLVSDSDLQSEQTGRKGENGSTWISLEDEEEKRLTCCANCSSNFESEARSLQGSTCNSESTSSSLPPWLKKYKDENKGNSNSDQSCVSVRELCRKWNSICSSIHKQSYSSERTFTFSSVSPSSSTCVFSHDQQHPSSHRTHHDHLFRIAEPRLKMHSIDYNNVKQAFSSNPTSTPNSASSSDVMEVDCVQKFKELNSENLKTLCDALEKKVPWQKDIIPEIVTTILRCRSGLVRRKERVKPNKDQVKEETWLLFQGVDVGAKEKVARELAKLVFGSQDNFISIALSSFSSTRADSTEDCRNKRLRDEKSGSYIERFAEALSSNPHRVFLVEDVDQADYSSQIGFKRAIESGKVTDSNGEEVRLKDAIIILSCESFSSRSRACSPPMKQKLDSCEEENGDAVEETNPCLSLDLNISIDEDSMEDQSIDDIGLLESVDRRVVFRIQELQ